MSTVLTNGIIIPENGSRNWGGDLANNWNILDVNVGYMNDVKTKVTTLENSVAENTANIQTNASNISALQTSKQDVIEDLETIRTGASAGATAVQPSGLNDYYTKTEMDTALTSKANDSDVVHKSGNETIGGVKDFQDRIVIQNTNSNGHTHINQGWIDMSEPNYCYIDFKHEGSQDYLGRIGINPDNILHLETINGAPIMANGKNIVRSVNGVNADSNGNVNIQGFSNDSVNIQRFSNRTFAYAYNTTSVIDNIHVGSVLTGDGKNVAFIVPLNIDGSPAISFDKLVIIGNGNYLFGSTSNSNVTTSYTFTSTVVRGGLIIVLTFSNAETKVPNNSCVATHVALRLTY